MKITETQREYLIANFPNTKNQECADALGVSLRTTIRMARQLGLVKTAEFIKAMQRNAAEHSARVNRALGGNKGTANLLKYGKAYRFKKGQYSLADKSEEELADIYRRIGESRKKTIKAEQRRVLFGLDQKTKLRVVQCGRDKVSLRTNLRKHGYIIGRASNEATITAGTRRSEKMEKRAEKLGIRFYC